MRNMIRSRLVGTGLMIALLLSLVPVSALNPMPVLAEGRLIDAPDTISADASDEIVYIDADGVIRVIDPRYDGPQVQWYSPDNDWRNFALGDFDNNGEMEIVAVRNNEFVAYDPVVASGTTVPGQEIPPGGIPWKEMARVPLPSRPETVGAGDFDPNVPGDEILVVRQVVPADGPDSGDTTNITIYKQNKLDVDGTEWVVHQSKNFSAQWERIAVGNADRTGGDEYVVIGTEFDQTVGKEAGIIEAYQPDQNNRRIFDYSSISSPGKDATFAQYYRGGNTELAWVRKSDLNSLWISTYSVSKGKYEDQDGERFEPEPRIIFAGDINGSGDDELIMLRSVSADLARLIVRGDGDDQIPEDFVKGLRLDDDSGYRAGAAGDIDGDDKDEIIIIRDDNVRWYPDAHTSIGYIDFPTTTNRRSVATGDLDALGFVSGPQFGTNVQEIEQEVQLGFSKQGSFTLGNVSTGDPIPFAISVTGNPTWLTVNPQTGIAPGSGSTPLLINYTIDGSQVPQPITQTVDINIIGTAGNVVNSPYVVKLTARFVEPPFQAVPAGAAASYYPCQDPLEERSLNFAITGRPGSSFYAGVIPGLVTDANMLAGETFLAQRTASGSLNLMSAVGVSTEVPLVLPADIGATTAVSFTSTVDWVTAVEADKNTVPANLGLTISPTLRTKDFDVAALILIGESFTPNEPFVVRAYGIELMCAESAAWLPLVRNRAAATQ